MHGFNDLQNGVLFVTLAIEGDELFLQVRDNGHPLPDNFEEVTQKTLGYKLIRTLVKQLQGTLNVVDKKTSTVEVRVSGHIMDFKESA